MSLHRFTAIATPQRQGNANVGLLPGMFSRNRL